MTLEELIAAYKSGELTRPLTIDNDDTFLYVQTDPNDETSWENVFNGGTPGELLEQALDLLGIPHEGV